MIGPQKKHALCRRRTCPAAFQMKLFRSKEPNLVHYVTAVTYQRVPVFKSGEACTLFVEALAETRLKDRFKLIGYVVMPDHFHLLVNPIGLNITTVVGKLKGRSASKILKRLRTKEEMQTLCRLKLPHALASGQTHALWLQDFSSVDIWSHPFIRQKLNYIHLSHVRQDCAIIQRNGGGRATMRICLTMMGRSRLKLIGVGCGRQMILRNRRTSPPSKRKNGASFRSRTCAA